MNETKALTGLEVAIVGMSGIFPGSPDCPALWKNLQQKKELLTRFSDAELLARGVPESLVKNPNYVKTMSVLQGKELYDAGFFGYTADDARVIDPQTRLFMEHCWAALEDAGCTSDMDNNKIGLFAGSEINDNWRLYVRNTNMNAPVYSQYHEVISIHSYIATMISHKLNLTGPSVYIDTACSTSLVAVHMACRSLLTRECGIALAGGSSVNTLLSKGFLFEEGLAFSNDGHNRTFDINSSGTAGSEGVAVVVLKRLPDALKDHDHIYAVIKASAVNNDGNRKVGYSAPSVQGQIDCIRHAQKLSRVDPKDITYVEAHGTATNLGDPIEISALNQAFNTGGSEKFCAVGSIKSNMGHLGVAAGVAGLIKTALSLHHRQIPANMYFEKPNPRIDFDSGPFYVNTSLRSWTGRNGKPLYAGVSAFGLGGTNAHLVLEEAPPAAPVAAKRQEGMVLTLSAKTIVSLAQYAEKLRAYLSENENLDLADMCYSLSVCRKHFEYRHAIPFRTKNELLVLLEGSQVTKRAVRARENKQKLVFMFSGVGSQYANMGKSLYENDPVFRAEFDKGIEVAKQITGRDYRSVIFPAPADKGAINAIDNIQPVIFIFEYALAKLLMEYGVEPDCMMGHSTGEYVAACLSGVFSYEDALRVVIRRGELGMQLPPGAMLGCALSEEMAKEYVGDKISLAAVNGSNQTILSGDPEAIDALAITLAGKDISAIKLNSPVAGHSYMLEPFLEDFRQAFNKVTLNRPAIRLVSGVAGAFIAPEDFTSPQYWVSHVRQPVLFYNGINAILNEYTNPVFVEIGAGNALANIVRKIESERELKVVNLVRNPREREDDAVYWSGKLGLLWMYGAKVKWDKKFSPAAHYKVALPTYAFERQAYPCEVNPEIPGFGKKEGHTTTVDNWGELLDASTNQGDPKEHAVLVLSGNAALAAEVTAELNASGHQYCFLEAGDALQLQQSVDRLVGDGFHFETGIFIPGSSHRESIAALLALSGCTTILLKRLYLITGEEKKENSTLDAVSFKALIPATALLFSSSLEIVLAAKNQRTAAESVQISTQRKERPDVTAPYAPPETGTEKKVRELFETVLNMEDIGVDDNFFELGGDSLQGMMLLKRISKEFNQELVIKDFFQEPSVRSIAAYIDRNATGTPGLEYLNNEITI